MGRGQSHPVLHPPPSICTKKDPARPLLSDGEVNFHYFFGRSLFEQHNSHEPNFETPSVTSSPPPVTLKISMKVNPKNIRRPAAPLDFFISSFSLAWSFPFPLDRSLHFTLCYNIALCILFHFSSSFFPLICGFPHLLSFPSTSYSHKAIC